MSAPDFENPLDRFRAAPTPSGGITLSIRGEQRCWVHKTANVLDKLPQNMQSKAKQALHDIYLAPSRKDAEKASDDFETLCEKKFPKAVECLRKDREELLAFYGFPAEH